MKQNKRSPITDKPLRNPGQSLEKMRDDMLYDKVLAPTMMALMMAWFTAMEWWYYFNPRTRNPLILSIFAVLMVAYAVWRIWRTWPQLHQLKQGIEGEKVVGQFLERLRGQGYQVFHDLQGEDFNVDHVIIGPAGVFTIETKTLSKPLRGETKIQFDGETVAVNGTLLERNPLRQAKAQASWLKKTLQEFSGRDFIVHPVVLFPGWYIEQRPGSLREIWVLEPKALPKFLSNAPANLSDEDVRFASNHLSRFIREQEKHSK